MRSERCYYFYNSRCIIGNFNEFALTMKNNFTLNDTPGPNYICQTGQCHTETVQLNYLALLLLVLCISVVFGNVLVILSVAKERSLQNITNYFIVSLAVADLSVAGVVMPFYTYTMVSIHFILTLW